MRGYLKPSHQVILKEKRRTDVSVQTALIARQHEGRRNLAHGGMTSVPMIWMLINYTVAHFADRITTHNTLISHLLS